MISGVRPLNLEEEVISGVRPLNLEEEVINNAEDGEIGEDSQTKEDSQGEISEESGVCEEKFELDCVIEGEDDRKKFIEQVQSDCSLKIVVSLLY